MKRKSFCFSMFLLMSGVVVAYGQKTVDATLVGKWCYINPQANSMESMTNSCVTLNADGTYEISLDRSTLPGGFSIAQDTDYGTWWVQGNRVFYISQSQGEGSFRFQKLNHPRMDNLPLVVLNGQAFGAASPRDPW